MAFLLCQNDILISFLFMSIIFLFFILIISIYPHRKNNIYEAISRQVVRKNFVRLLLIRQASSMPKLVKNIANPITFFIASLLFLFLIILSICNHFIKVSFFILLLFLSYDLETNLLLLLVLLPFLKRNHLLYLQHLEPYLILW